MYLLMRGAADMPREKMPTENIQMAPQTILTAQPMFLCPTREDALKQIQEYNIFDDSDFMNVTTDEFVVAGCLVDVTVVTLVEDPSIVHYILDMRSY